MLSLDPHVTKLRIGPLNVKPVPADLIQCFWQLEFDLFPIDRGHPSVFWQVENNRDLKRVEGFEIGGNFGPRVDVIPATRECDMAPHADRRPDFDRIAIGRRVSEHNRRVTGVASLASAAIAGSQFRTCLDRFFELAKRQSFADCI
jgi:hypothetical protein